MSVRAPAADVNAVLRAAEAAEGSPLRVRALEAPAGAGEGAWTVVVGGFVTGLAEALSSTLGTTVVIWFSDPVAAFNRLEVWDGGELTLAYPSRLDLHRRTVPDPASLDGTEPGLRAAAATAGAPLAWDGPSGR